MGGLMESRWATTPVTSSANPIESKFQVESIPSEKSIPPVKVPEAAMADLDIVPPQVIKTDKLQNSSPVKENNTVEEKHEVAPASLMESRWATLGHSAVSIQETGKGPWRSKEERVKHEAMVKHVIDVLHKRYGSKNVRLKAWQALCRDVNEPEGKSIAQCKKQMEEVFVNIVDYVKTIDKTDPEYGSAVVHRFPTEEELRKYSKATRKIYPLGEAKQSEILKALLIHIPL